jgi:hypothetical protein
MSVLEEELVGPGFSALPALRDMLVAGLATRSPHPQVLSSCVAPFHTSKRACLAFFSHFIKLPERFFLA